MITCLNSSTGGRKSSPTGAEQIPSRNSSWILQQMFDDGGYPREMKNFLRSVFGKSPF
jgi:hypothetical protein